MYDFCSGDDGTILEKHKSQNTPPLVISNLISTKLDRNAYKHWMIVWKRHLEKINGFKETPCSLNVTQSKIFNKIII